MNFLTGWRPLEPAPFRNPSGQAGRSDLPSSGAGCHHPELQKLLLPPRENGENCGAALAGCAWSCSQFSFFLLEQFRDVSKRSRSYCPRNTRMERKILFDILATRAQEYPRNATSDVYAVFSWCIHCERLPSGVITTRWKWFSIRT